MSEQFNVLDDPDYSEEDAAYDYAAMVSFGATNGLTEPAEQTIPSN